MIVVASPPGSRLTKMQKHHLRDRARKHLPALLIQQESKCYWCGEEIVQLRSIPPEMVVKVHAFELIYRVSDRIETKLRATIDHLKGLDGEEPNRLENLVAACAVCNVRLSSTPRTRRAVCRKCGRPKPNDKRRTCEKCRHEGWIWWVLNQPLAVDPCT
jgi:uncharacterized protein with PIN domain